MQLKSSSQTIPILPILLQSFMMNSNRMNPGDHIVYPVHLLDNAHDYRKLFMSYIFRFNNALDSEKLADSLSTLLETGDWKKLGGRFRFNVRCANVSPWLPA